MSFYSSVTQASKVATAIYKLLATSILGYYMVKELVRKETKRV